MRRCIVTLLVFALTLTLVLPGCGPKTPTDEGPIPINPDGTIGLLRWGMTCEEAEKADRRIVFNKDPNVPAGVCNVEFLGHQAGLALHFRSFPEEGDDAPERLWLIKVFFNLERGEPDYIPIVGAYFTETAEDGQSYGYGGWASTEWKIKKKRNKQYSKTKYIIIFSNKNKNSKIRFKIRFFFRNIIRRKYNIK